MKRSRRRPIEAVEQEVTEVIEQEAPEVQTASYKEYSCIAGWYIFKSLDAEPEKRWRINHPKYGEHFFAKHSEIQPWTQGHMRGLFR